LYHSQWFDLSKVEETWVEYTTIEKIFKQNSIIECDWVVIDAEGIDAELILSFDWESYNVSRIEFEHTHLDYNAKAVNAYLTSMGYMQVPSLNPDEDVAYENPRIIKQKDPNYAAQKLVNFPKIHYISVTDEVDRRSLLERKFETYGISKERLIPHIFDRYDDSKHNIKCEYNDWKLSIGSRGPVTSHLKAIRDWYENTNEPYAFFCEDDLSLESV